MNTPQEIKIATTPRDRLFRWVENQGVSTVLLLAIMVGVYTGYPRALDQIQKGYDRHASELNKAMETHVLHTERLINVIEQHAIAEASDRGVSG